MLGVALIPLMFLQRPSCDRMQKAFEPIPTAHRAAHGLSQTRMTGTDLRWFKRSFCSIAKHGSRHHLALLVHGLAQGHHGKEIALE